MSSAPNVLQLGDYPCSEGVFEQFLNATGTLLRLQNPDDLLDPFFAGRKLKLEGLVCGIHHKLGEAHFKALPHLRVVSNFGAGLDHLPLPYLKAQGISLANTPDLLAEATADLTLGLILAVQRRFTPGQALLKAGEFTGWQPFFELSPGVNGKALGLLGFGNIAKQVAKRAQAFSMKVFYTKRQRLSHEEEALFQVSYLPWPELLATSDVLSLHCPYTPQTHHIVDAKALQQMKTGAALINTARGPLVDEAALAEALQSGHLHGAGLDVFEQEPKVNPALWACPNVLLLPHLGSATVATRNAMGDRTYQNLLLGLAGQAMLSPVVL